MHSSVQSANSVAYYDDGTYVLLAGDPNPYAVGVRNQRVLQSNRAEGVCLSAYARAWKSRPRFRPFGSLKPSGSLAALAEYNQSSARRILRKDYLAVAAVHR